MNQVSSSEKIGHDLDEVMPSIALAVSPLAQTMKHLFTKKNDKREIARLRILKMYIIRNRSDGTWEGKCKRRTYR
jgi:hypothetical protein